jgi:thiol-disulfide isomerase/thioredoxin/Tfp pilus assembly protein PilF
MVHISRRVLAALLTLGLAASLQAQQPAPPDPKFTAALQKGENALKVRRWQDALEAFRDANGMMDRKSPAALYGVARAFHGLKAYKSEADACKDALKYVGNDLRFEAMLRNQLGMALYAQAEKNTDKAIKDAETEFRAALQLAQAPPITHYNLGLTLLKQSRDDEGKAALQIYRDFGLSTPESDLARRMIENPRRGRETYAPDYSFTSAQGEYFSSKELEGKVVFIDFWGEWCGPCRAITPDLVRVYKKYKDNPNFVMLGISSDSREDEQKWKDYVAKNKMDWPQFLDLRREVINRFQVQGYPTGIVISHEGIVLHAELGGGRAGVDVIDGAIKRGLKALEAK